MPETRGDKPQNHGLSDFKVVPEQRGVGPRVQKPEESKQQPFNPYHELTEYNRREQERHHGVFENPIQISLPYVPKKPRRGR
jgi:hypothetical protein